MLAQADEVVNIDLTADELITRLKEGKIYEANKIETAILKTFQERTHPAVAGTGPERSCLAGWS